ncbi:hypothetical protein C1H46_028430 [Malus baccata]|uniref:BTB domain-containing protein n=1 Tax=Malus baccata TaxID=106549 RepID=A0A540LHP4_MALBA|nr:hypothetical protein C1H46_028430 [Malus baccata]
MAYRFCSVCHDQHLQQSLSDSVTMQYPSTVMTRQPAHLTSTLKDVLGWVLESDKEVKAQTEKLKFLAWPAYGDVLACSDLLVHPGDNIGPPIRAHKIILATRSKILDTITPDSSQSITLPEMTNHEELESLLEFLYHGQLPEERFSKNIYSLTLAAQKYKIAYLEELCGRHLNLSNVDVLELADSRASKRLKMNALEYIAEHKSEVVSSNKFDTFAMKHPHLCLQILKDSLFKSGLDGRQ